MKRISLMLSLSLVCGAACASPPELAPRMEKVAAVSTVAPLTRATDQPNALLLAFKQNDFAALMLASERSADIVEIAKEWDARVDSLSARRSKRAEEMADDADADRAARADDPMEQAWIKLQSAEGVDLLVAELQPKIAEEMGDSLMKFNVGFGAALMAIASDKDLNAVEVQQLTQLMYAVQNWTGRVDFADAERLRRALQAVSRLVRQTGLKHFDDTQTLRFEDAVVHGDTLIATIKQVLAAYDIPVDEILNSVRISEIDAYADKATIHLEARVFGVDVSHNFKRQYFNDEWMDPSMVAMLSNLPESGADLDSENAKIEAMIDTPPPPPPPVSDISASSCKPKGKVEGAADAEGKRVAE